MVRKAAAGVALILAIMIIAAIDASYFYINWPGKEPEIKRSITLHQEYYAMENALELAGVYLGTSLRYSVYQAMYDNGLRGGHAEMPADTYTADAQSYALWYSGKDMQPDEQALLSGLKEASEKNLAKYTKSDYVFLDYSVKLPGYTLELSRDNGLKAEATADKDLWISKTMQNLDTILLQKSGNLVEEFEDTYHSLYQEAVTRLAEVKGVLADAKAAAAVTDTATATEEQEGSQPQVSKEEVMLIAAETGDGIIKNEIDPLLGQLNDEVTQDKRAVDFEVLEKTVSVKDIDESDCTVQETNYESGGKTVYKTEKTCTFTYEYKFIVKVSVADGSGKKYPVFDGEEVSFKAISLVFAAQETNQ